MTGIEPLVAWLIGTGGGFIIAGVVLVLYERQNKQLRKYLEYLQKQLNGAHAKMMTVDYEKLAELDIRARAHAQQAWMENAYGGLTAEMSDLDIQDPDEIARNLRGVGHAE